MLHSASLRGRDLSRTAWNGKSWCWHVVQAEEETFLEEDPMTALPAPTVASFRQFTDCGPQKAFTTLKSVGPDLSQCSSIAPSPPGLPACRPAPAPPSSLVVLRLLRWPGNIGAELLGNSQSTILQKDD